jgi:hypothetical protein
MTALSPGRIPCPDCGQSLALPIEAVLAGRPILCAGCGLELQVNRRDSEAALSALGRWWSETAPARAAAEAVPAEPAVGVSGRRGRRPRR